MTDVKLPDETQITDLDFFESCYRFISILAAIYAISEEHTLNQAEKKFWQSLSMSLVTDLGVIHTHWNGRGVKGAQPLPELEKPYRALITTLSRLEQVIAKLSLWTSQQQRLGVSYLAERYLQRVLNELDRQEKSEALAELIAGAINRAESQIVRLKELDLPVPIPRFDASESEELDHG